MIKIVLMLYEIEIYLLFILVTLKLGFKKLKKGN